MHRQLGWVMSGLLWATACGGSKDDDALDEDVYAACDDADACEAPEGFDPVCLDKGDEGFCTATCEVDDDCAEEGFVCASFESNEEVYCFPSCEDDPEGCPSGFGCRSTGGGSENRKVCFPEDVGTAP